MDLYFNVHLLMCGMDASLVATERILEEDLSCVLLFIVKSACMLS